MARPGVGNPGNKGGVGGSRRKVEMDAFYKKLDAACLDSVDYLVAILKQATKDDRFVTDRDWRHAGIDAAGKIIAKAPERIQEDFSGLIEFKWQD